MRTRTKSILLGVAAAAPGGWPPGRARCPASPISPKWVATTPARWSTGESPAPAHRRNFQSMLFGSNKLPATEGRDTPTTCGSG